MASNKVRRTRQGLPVGYQELAVLQWVGNPPWDTVVAKEKGGQLGVSGARMSQIAHGLKKKGLIVEAPPYALTKRGRDAINDLAGEGSPGAGPAPAQEE